MSPTVEVKVVRIFEKAFPGAALEKLKCGLYPWDSLKHLELLNAIEHEFSIRLTISQALKIDTKDAAVKEVVRSIANT